MADKEIKFCPRCGATNRPFYNGLCVDCYKELHSTELVSFPSKVVVERCPHCGKYFYKGKCLPSTYNSLQKVIASKVKSKLYKTKIDVDAAYNSVVITVSGFIDAEEQIPFKIEKELPLKIKGKVCDTCSKLHGNYHEVKIQARRKKGSNRKDYEKLLADIRHSTRKLRALDDRAAAFWEKKTREGTDFFYVHKQSGEEIVKAIEKKYNLKAKHSTRIGRKGRRKHTYSIRV